MATLKKGQGVFIKHLPYAKAVVVGPRPGDVGTPEEHTRVVVKIAEEQRICVIAELEIEQAPPEASTPADWQGATDAVAHWLQDLDNKELRDKAVAALTKIGWAKKK